MRSRGTEETGTRSITLTMMVTTYLGCHLLQYNLRVPFHLDPYVDTTKNSQLDRLDLYTKGLNGRTIPNLLPTDVSLNIY